MDNTLRTAIIESGYKVPAGHTAVELLPELLAGLGSVDPDERDSFALAVLCKWIRAGSFSAGELCSTLDPLLDNLRAGIGEGENDLVFLRSFSALTISTLINRDREMPFLGAENLRRILDAALRYTTEEQDLRGYVPVKGWADSTAHTADLLDSLVKHGAVGRPEIERILDAIVIRISAATDIPVASNEEYRIGAVMVSILRRELLPLSRLIASVKQLDGTIYLDQALLGLDGGRYRRVKVFLAALHVMLMHADVPTAAREQLLPVVYDAIRSYIPWVI